MTAYLNTRVLVTGNQLLVRTAIARLIAVQPEMDVIGECLNEREALARALALDPDLVLMDVDDDRTPGEPVIELLASIRQFPVVVLTGNENPHHVSMALGRGASGVVFKSRPFETLIRAIRAVVAGEEPSMLSSMFQPKPREQSAVVGRLTPREQEIVELVSLGLKNKIIGERLFITETTVRHHLTSIFNKLEVKSRLELMRYAYGGGTFVPVETPRKLSLPPMRGGK